MNYREKDVVNETDVAVEKKEKYGYWFYAKLIYIILILIFIIILFYKNYMDAKLIANELRGMNDYKMNEQRVIDMIEEMSRADGLKKLFLNMNDLDKQIIRVFNSCDIISIKKASVFAYYNLKGEEAISDIMKMLDNEIALCPNKSVIQCHEYEVISKIVHVLRKENKYDMIFEKLMDAHYYQLSKDINDKRIIPYLVKALEDDNPIVRIDAASYLVGMGQKDGLIYDVVIDYLSNEWAAVKSQKQQKLSDYGFLAIKILNVIRDERALSLLEEIEQQSSPPYSIEASKAINNIRKVDVRIY